ncbi:hypothetical protein ILYODFUR_037138, partial [Ilyodon furcidens]
TEHQDQDRVTLSCSVLTDGQCEHRVKWLFNGNDVDKTSQELEESSSSCSAAVNFRTSHYVFTSRFNLFSCEVKTRDDKVQLFTFSSRPSDQGKTTATTEPTFASPENPVPAEHLTDWWRFLLGSVGLAALIAAVGIINIWTRTKGRKTHLDENPVCLDEDDDAVNYENIRTSTV